MDEGSADDVVILRWPGEQTRLADLRQQRIPRLALVSPHAPAFRSSDPLEDWVRLPASEGDVRARVRTLLARAHDERPDAPELGDGRVLRYGSWWTTLAPTEARLAETFVDRFGGVVSRVELASAGWPEGLPSRNSLDVLLGRIRRRLDGSSLVLRTVRSRGCMLTVEPRY